MSKLIEAVIRHWGGMDVEPDAIRAVSAFGHLVIRDRAGAFWHLDPEMLSLDRVAENADALMAFWGDPEFEEVWRAEALVAAARATLGELREGQCYGWKVPPMLGGEFDAANMCILPAVEIVGFSGDLAAQLRDLPDGAQVRLKVVE